MGPSWQPSWREMGGREHLDLSPLLTWNIYPISLPSTPPRTKNTTHRHRPLPFWPPGHCRRQAYAHWNEGRQTDSDLNDALRTCSMQKPPSCLLFQRKPNLTELNELVPSCTDSKVTSVQDLCSFCSHHCPDSCQVMGQPDSESPLFPFSLHFFGNPRGLFPVKGQPGDSWGLLKRHGNELSLLGPLSGLVSVEDFPLQEAQLPPHCQLLAGYHGNRPQEGSAFLSLLEWRGGFVRGQRFPLRGQEKDWLWATGLMRFCLRTPLFVSRGLPIFHSEEQPSFCRYIFFLLFWWLKCLFFHEMIMMVEGMVWKMSSLGNVKSLLIHATIWMSLKILMLSEISLAKTECML